MKLVLAIHQWLYEQTRGVVGHRLLGVPTLLLTTTGRRSGLARHSALVYAERDEWWKLCNDANKGRFDDHQEATDRQIPVVVLRSQS